MIRLILAAASHLVYTQYTQSCDVMSRDHQHGAITRRSWGVRVAEAGSQTHGSEAVYCVGMCALPAVSKNGSSPGADGTSNSITTSANKSR